MAGGRAEAIRRKRSAAALPAAQIERHPPPSTPTAILRRHQNPVTGGRLGQAGDQPTSIDSEKRTVKDADVRVAMAASPSATQN